MAMLHAVEDHGGETRRRAAYVLGPESVVDADDEVGDILGLVPTPAFFGPGHSK